MTKLLQISFFLVFSFCTSMIFPHVSAATLPWSSNFSACADWTESLNGPNPNCPSGIQMDLDSAFCATQNYGEQITSAAANPICGSTKGQRHWMGDGHNNNSGGLKVIVNPSPTEIWIRFYARWALGFKWSSLAWSKILYLNNNTSYNIEVDWPDGEDSTTWDEWRVVPYGTGQVNTPRYCLGAGWETVMANGAIDPSTGKHTSDGKWHLFEMHFKSNGPNGVADIKVDGAHSCSIPNLDIGSTQFTQFAVGSNQSYPSNGGCTPLDYNDIAVSATGPIGPCTGNTISVPSPPSGVH